MKQPFEGLFGDTCETRLLHFFLPMYGIEFDMADLIDEVRLTRQSISKAIKKFSDLGMVKIRKEGRTWLYSINEDSPLVKRLEDFDNSLIESMVGEKEFRKMVMKDIRQVHGSPGLVSRKRLKKATHRFGASGETIPVVAESPGVYRSRKRK